ncbi:MAG: YfiR family protein, partial [Anaerolineales bacterium]
ARDEGRAAGGGDPRPYAEYEVKAAMLYNFATFVDWPTGAFQGPGGPLSLCIYGENPFGAALERAFSDRSIHGRLVKVQRFSRMRDLQPCHILFIGESAARDMPLLLESLWGAPVLTVGEAPNFNSSGGMIRFHIEESRVRFEINPQAAARAGLRLHRRLLELSSGSRMAGHPPSD